MKRRGAFIVLEGPDKSGKSTHAAFLVQYLRGQGLRVIHTREPGGTSFAEAIRKILLDPNHKVHPVAELLLYEAARAQHTHELLLPYLKSGSVVICERYTLATLVYQGFARGLGMAMIRSLNKIASAGLAPDLTIVLDIPESEFSVRDPGRAHDRLEKESEIFRRKVRKGYQTLAKKEPKTFAINADRDLDKVRQAILSLIMKKTPWLMRGKA